MTFKRRIGFLSFAMLLAIGLALPGCASSESTEPECTSGADCALGEDCNVELGVCEEAVRGDSNPNNDDNNSTPNNTSPGPDADGADSGTPDADDPTPDPDAGGADTDPATDTDPETDTNPPGVCDPGCGDDETCEDGQCVATPDPTCTRKGEACNPAVADQGTFWCAGDGNGGGECLPKCSDTLSANGCAVGEYCWNLGSEEQPAPACIESDCSANSDCTSNTCLNFDNQFGLCIASGSTPEGGSCDPSVRNTCTGDHYCREEPRGSGSGTCRKLCDPWAFSSSCPTGQLCDLFTVTNREGICVPEVTTGSQPFDRCGTVGSMCDDGLICLEGSTDNICVGYCRPGYGDCGNMPVPLECDNYVVPGERAWGLCLGRCPDIQCSAGSVCQNGICRQSCSAQTVAQDCCGGSTPCDWTCPNGFCE